MKSFLLEKRSGLSQISFDEVDLKLCATNGTDIPFLGWISCEFQLKNSTESISVPFIVSKQKLNYSFIGYNITEELYSRTDKTGERLTKESLVSSLSGITASNVDAFVNLSEVQRMEHCVMSSL